jgi:excisionase family DNA binding protein
MKLLRPTDVAERLSVSRAWVYEAAKTGRIPSIRIGGDDGPLRFVPEDIDRWLADARARWPSAEASRAPEGRNGSEAPARRRSVRRASGAQRTDAEQQSLL